MSAVQDRGLQRLGVLEAFDGIGAEPSSIESEISAAKRAVNNAMASSMHPFDYLAFRATSSTVEFDSLSSAHPDQTINALLHQATQ